MNTGNNARDEKKKNSKAKEYFTLTSISGVYTHVTIAAMLVTRTLLIVACVCLMNLEDILEIF